jgi:hypothetical protein
MHQRAGGVVETPSGAACYPYVSAPSQWPRSPLSPAGVPNTSATRAWLCAASCARWPARPSQARGGILCRVKRHKGAQRVWGQSSAPGLLQRRRVWRLSWPGGLGGVCLFICARRAGAHVELALTGATAADATSAVATWDDDDGAGEDDASAIAGAWIGTAATTPIRASHTSLLLPAVRCI